MEQQSKYPPTIITLWSVTAVVMPKSISPVELFILIVMDITQQSLISSTFQAMAGSLWTQQEKLSDGALMAVNYTLGISPHIQLI